MTATTHSGMTEQRRRWRISGRVQGVGFRPFVYRIARTHQLHGFVRNDSAGVVIEAQGIQKDLDAFAQDLKASAPAQAAIQRILSTRLPPVAKESDFVITKSDAACAPSAEIACDLAVCKDCLSELRNLRDARRSGYGLVNCTACGPRFSIIRGVPYDRPSTTMASFVMCGECKKEYVDPGDRRFHAQPTACHTCGPKVELVTPSGQTIEGDPIQQTAKRLLAGEIVAIKGIGGFHLAARADDEEVVRRLRQIKHRRHKPFALMAANIDAARKIVDLGNRASRLLESPQAPIVLAARKTDCGVASAVAPGNHRLGVMLAYTPIHHLIFDAMQNQFPALVMTSANDSDEPLVFTNEDAIAHLGNLCDAILWHHRPIERPVDDSVVLDTGAADPLLLRRSRGYVPTPLALPEECRSAGICVGGELKNTIAIVRGNEVVLSQHLGDLENARSYANFKRAVEDLARLFAVKPRWIAHDLHPTYLSTTYAKRLSNAMKIPAMGFQHHHTHAAAVLAEHRLVGPSLAVVCDGTGYGTDGTIWGGELLAFDFKEFRRLAHIRPMLLPGGDASAKQTWRCAMSLLYNAFGQHFVEVPILRNIAPGVQEAQFVAGMMLHRSNCAASSAAGRLFDGVAALLGLGVENHFEAQGPLALEAAATKYGEAPPQKQLLFEINANGSNVVDFSPLIRKIVNRREHGDAVPELAAIFHDQFAAAWEIVVMRAAEQTGLARVALSGGVMCNAIVDRLLTERLRKRGLNVLRHRLVPPNDGGLALGQAALAVARSALMR